jgi:metacaspase-1
MHPESRLTILFDCCHSGSACELPFVYRPDADGNVNLIDLAKKGMELVQGAHALLRGGLTDRSVDDAKMLLGGATDFFRGVTHRGEGGEVDEDGLAKEQFSENWHDEGKDVWMFSGCADDQTSADTAIAGLATGAMSWAFIGTMREHPNQSYIEVCGFSLHDSRYNRRLTDPDSAKYAIRAC